MSGSTARIVIVGGGTGGLTVAARLARFGLAPQLTIIEPSETHDYQPIWTLVGAGVVPQSSRRPEADYIPRDATWLKDAVRTFAPDRNQVITTGGRTVDYDVLIVATGLEVNFGAIAGLEGRLGRDGLCTIYDYDQASRTASIIREFKGGSALFTMPPVPIKCAGAPQKIMYLADDVWRRSGVRAKSKVSFATAGAVIFGIKEYAAALLEVASRKQLDLLFGHNLIEVKASAKVAVFDVGGARVEKAYDLLHVVPPMRAPGSVRDSALASTETGQVGWLAVDKHTLQHKSFPNVFGVGDVTGIPNSKTGAAVRKQAPVAVDNVRRLLAGRELSPTYDGYASCPLTTEIGKVMLAEFGYDGVLMPSFPLDSTVPRRAYWHLKKTFLPLMYWNGMLRGRM